jgi:hypothetical protein
MRRIECVEEEGGGRRKDGVGGGKWSANSIL